jgi:lipoprotein NlpD
MKTPFVRIAAGVLSAGLLSILTACSSSPRQPAPVEDRGMGARPSAPAPSPTEVKPLPGAENAGKPGYYTVQKGDTLTRVALEHGQAWRDLARWNNLSNPDVIEVGQVLRVVPPGSAVESSGVVVRPVTSSAASAPKAAASAPAAAASAPAASSTAPANASNAGSAEDFSLAWPANGQVLAGFDEAKNKGIDIAGKAGDPVTAAADGQVVYAGAGLRGYGNLVIVKHNNTYLTAYAHNQKLLVKEDQKVRKGDKIAEMGSSDADRVKLHFEVRRQGKPVDPSRYLAAR